MSTILSARQLIFPMKSVTARRLVITSMLTWITSFSSLQRRFSDSCSMTASLTKEKIIWRVAVMDV